jgi:hypothetical protein
LTDANVLQVFYDLINTDATVWQVKTTTPAGNSSRFTAESTGTEPCEINFRISSGQILVALAAGGGITDPTTPAGTDQIEEEFVQDATASHTSFHLHEWNDAICMTQSRPGAIGTCVFDQGFQAGKVFWPFFVTDVVNDGFKGYAMIMGDPLLGASASYWLTRGTPSKSSALVASSTWVKLEYSGLDGTGSAFNEPVSGRIQPAPVTVENGDNGRPLGVLKYFYRYYAAKGAGTVWTDSTNFKELVFVYPTTAATSKYLIPIAYTFDPTT